MGQPFKDTVFIDDAIRINGPMAFNIMIKPAGSLCNLDCQYCYYLDKSEIYGGLEPRMSLEMLEIVVREYIKANDVPEVTFNWHGGEPTILGIDFYRKALEFENKYAGGKTIHNTLQTNGTLLNAEWADFFRRNNFLIGISLDGPKDIHDRYRRDKGGNPTFDRVVAGLKSLRDHGVEFNTMSTVNKFSEGRGLEVYQFLKSQDSRYIQFMPVVEHVKYPEGPNGKINKFGRPSIVCPDTPGSKLAPWSVSAFGYGRFMRDIFDYWVRNDVGTCFLNLFDATLANWCGVMPGTCAHAGICGGNSVVEHNGDMYPCDHFVYPKYRLGNIADRDIRTMMESVEQRKFGIDKRSSLPSKCIRCDYLFACNGGCPKHRFNKTESGDTGLNALCEGYRYFYSHTDKYMRAMKQLLEKHRPPADIMAVFPDSKIL